MKTSKLKMLLAAIIIFTSSTFVLGNDPSSTKYLKENSDVKNDISNMNLIEQDIKSLKDKIKADLNAGLKTEVIMDQRALMKRRADLKQQQAYFRADKMDLVKDHKLAICSARATVKKDQAKLSDAQSKLKKDLAANNESNIESDAKLVAQQQRILKRDQSLLDSEQQSLNSDLVAVRYQLNPKSGHSNTASSYAQAD